MNTTVLVIGASSGIGEATATALARRGHRVFGTSRDASRVRAAGVEPLTMDVLDANSVEAGIQSILDDGGRLDAVVYSASSYVAGAVEETTTEQLRDQFDVFFFGAHRVTRAVLPHFRASGGGRLVFLSSSAGVAALPYHVAYSASKAALEHYCEGLRYEVEPFGVSVSYLQATGVKTGGQPALTRAASPVDAYEPARDRAIQTFHDGQTDGMPLGGVVEVLVGAVEAERPRPVLRVGGQAKALPWLHALLPERLFRSQVQRSLGL